MIENFQAKFLLSVLNVCTLVILVTDYDYDYYGYGDYRGGYNDPYYDDYYGYEDFDYGGYGGSYAPGPRGRGRGGPPPPPPVGDFPFHCLSFRVQVRLDCDKLHAPHFVIKRG